MTDEVSLTIQITPGPIEVESISGQITDTTIFAYINTAEKYVVADALTDNEVFLRVGERTRRAGDLIGEQVGDTIITFPEDFVVEVSEGRYAVRVIGVRHPLIPEVNIPTEIVWRS